MNHSNQLNFYGFNKDKHVFIPIVIPKIALCINGRTHLRTDEYLWGFIILNIYWGDSLKMALKIILLFLNSYLGKFYM